MWSRSLRQSQERAVLTGLFLVLAVEGADAGVEDVVDEEEAHGVPCAAELAGQARGMPCSSRIGTGNFTVGNCWGILGRFRLGAGEWGKIWCLATGV